jgi:hypothetical protein
LLVGLPFYINDPDGTPEEINRVLYLSAEQEEYSRQHSGNPKTTVTATYNVKSSVLKLTFWISYEDTESHTSFDGGLIGFVPSVIPSVVPTPSIVTSASFNGPLNVTLFIPPPIPILPPVLPRISIQVYESHWNNLVTAAKALNLTNLDLELIANQVKSRGILIPAFQEISSNSVWNFTISRSRKRKANEISDNHEEWTPRNN